MPKKIEYEVRPEAVKDFQTAYDGLMMSKDILDKMRGAGEAKPDLEARNRAAIERTLRWAASFKIKIVT